MTQRLYDVVIAGAGPAGTRMGRDLARRGHDVLVIEEHRAIGEPCHCSGLVTPRTLDLADVGDDIVCNVIRGASVHVQGRAPTRIAGNRVHAYVVDRAELDRRLADQARAAGATILHDTRFVRFDYPNGTPGRAGRHAIRIHVVAEGVPAALLARVLGGADGGHSRVAQQIRGSAPAGVVVGLGALASYEANPREDHVELFLDPESAPGWFGWTIPLRHGLARIGTGSANGIRPRESFRRLRRRFPDTFGTARVHSRSGGLIALWQPNQMSADGVVLVGDAARQVKPTSGGGIYAALNAAGMAAATVDQALRSGDVSRHGLRAYPRVWRTSLGRELRRQHDLHQAFARLETRDLAEILELLEDSSVRRAIDDHADIDFPSHLVAQLILRKPRLLLKLLRVPRFPLAWLPGG